MKRKINPKSFASPPFLELRNVTVLRSRTTALRNVTLSIASGENVAVLGPNGSGKSTLIKAITRECYPSDGSLRIYGKERWDIFDLRRRLGIVTADMQHGVSQNVAGRDIPAMEAVLSGFFSSVGVWSKEKITAEMRKKAKRVLAFLGMAGLEQRPLNEMSAGEARRVMIGRALIHDPETLVLDEPSTSLDFQAVGQFRRLVRKIARAGKSVVLVTHDPRDLVPEIGRVVLLRRGEIFKDGPVKDVLNESNLSALFQTPIRMEKTGGQYRFF